MKNLLIVFTATLLIGVAKSNLSLLPKSHPTSPDTAGDAFDVSELEGQETTQNKRQAPISQSPSFLSENERIGFRNAIPGEPEIDYPVYSSPPETSFTCTNRPNGYYADVEARCQVFRVCANTDLTGKGFAFLCPNGTLFNQEVFVCDWHQHVNCKGSINYYAKNAEMRMNFNSVSDMMAVVNEMVNFPLKLVPPSEQRNDVPNDFDQQIQVQRPIPATASPSNERENNQGLTPPDKPNSFTKTSTQEGDFNIKTTDGLDDVTNSKQSTFTAQPIYISSLGELSTDLGDKFDITKVRLIKPADSSTPRAVLDSQNDSRIRGAVLSQPIQPVGQSQDQFSTQAIDSGEGDLLGKSIQRKQNASKSPVNVVNLSESGLVSPTNPSSNNNERIAVNSGEGDLLNQAIQRQQNAQFANFPVDGGSGNLLGQSIQDSKPNGNNFRTTAVDSGEGDLLSQAIRRQQEAERLLKEAIESGNANLLGQSIQNSQQNGNLFRTSPVSSGEGNLLQQGINELNKNQFRTSPIDSGEGNLLQQGLQSGQLDNKNQFPTGVDSGSGNLLQQGIGANNLNNGRSSSIDSGEGNLLQQGIRNQLLNRDQPAIGVESGQGNLLQQLGNQFASAPVDSGEKNLLQQGIGNNNLGRGPLALDVESGQANLLQQGFPNIGLPNNQVSTSQVDSGEGNLLQQGIQNSLPNQNQFSSVPISSGDENLLQHGIRTNGLNNNQFKTAVESGQGNLLQQGIQNANLQRNQFITSPVSSGEENLLQQGIRSNPQNAQFLTTTTGIDSGEENLLQQALRNYQLKNSQLVTGVPVQSGQGNLLQQGIANIPLNINQYSTSPIDSGEGSLLQQGISNNLLNGNQYAVNAINSGEQGSLAQIIQRQQSQKVDSGAGDLLGQSLKSQPISKFSIKSGGISSLNQNIQTNYAHGPAPSINAGVGHPPYSLEQSSSINSYQQHKQSNQNQLTENAFRDQANIYTHSTLNHQIRSQSTLTNSQNYHYKITQTQTYSPESDKRIPTSTVPYTYIPPHTTLSPIISSTSKQVFTYPEIHLTTDEVRQSFVGYRQADYDKYDNDSVTETDVEPIDKTNKNSLDIIKERQSTDLLLKELQVYLYDKNELKDTRIKYFSHYKNETLAQKAAANSSIRSGNYADFPESQNFDKLIIDLMKIAAFNETENSEERHEYADIDYDESINETDSKTYETVNDALRDILNAQLIYSTFNIPEGDTNFLTNRTQEKRERTLQTYPDDRNENNLNLNSTEQQKLLLNSQKIASNPNQKPQNAEREATAQSTQQQVVDQEDSASQRKYAQQSSAQAFFFTEIENRPIVNYNIPHPPLQMEYPKSILNDNYHLAARVVNKGPPSVPQFVSPTPIPSSLPSIVHQPSKTVAQIQNVPFVQKAPVISASPAIVNIQAVPSSPQYYKAPVITSTYSNRENYAHLSSNPREKVVVNVVHAPGWYLNDENERKSYFNAVAHGLLSKNGLVYVNNVQKVHSHSPTIQTQPNPVYSYGPAVTYSSKHIIPPALLQSQSVYSAQAPASPNVYAPPCVQVQQIPAQIQSRQLSFARRQDDAQGVYAGTSSYNVPLKSVGKLAGDNLSEKFSLSSLRPSSQTSRKK